MNDVAKHTIDGGAIIVAVTTFIGILPDIAAALSVIWLALRVMNEWHSWLHRKRR